MILAFELAGTFAAHAIWCVSDSDGLIPMLAYKTFEGERKMERLVFDDMEVAVAHGREKLDTNSIEASESALLYDGRIVTDGGKLDAIIIEVRNEFMPQSKAIIAVPYTSRSTGKFRVHKPKLLKWEHCEDFAIDAVLEAFFAGVSQHEKGAEVWNNALDESK